MNAARHERGVGAAGPHGLNKDACARHQLDPCLEDLLEDTGLHSLEKRHPFAERRLEGNLAAHRPLGNRPDMVAEADHRGELVDAFLADDGRIHIGHEQLLPTVLAGTTLTSTGRPPMKARMRPRTVNASSSDAWIGRSAAMLSASQTGGSKIGASPMMAATSSGSTAGATGLATRLRTKDTVRTIGLGYGTAL